MTAPNEILKPAPTAEPPIAPLEDRFRAFTTSAPVGIYELTPEGGLVFANERSRNLIGTDFEGAAGFGWMEAIHPDDRDRVIEEWGAALSEDREFELEYRFLHPGGRTVWVVGRATALRDEAGETTGLLGTLTDITELKEAQEALALRGEVIRNMAGGVCVVRSADGMIVDTNPTFDRMLHYAPGELHGQPVHTLHPSDLGTTEEGSACRIIDQLGSGETVSYESNNVRKDGAQIWCRATTSTFEHPEHGMVWVAVQEEITDERRARAALREAEERFRRAFEDSASGMALIEGKGDNIGRFLEVNPALTLISGYSADQLLGMSYWDLVHPDELDSMRAGIVELIAGRATSFQSEQRMIAAMGATRWIAFSVSLVRDEAGEPINAVVQAQDVTERRRAEDELRYMADHDPLTGLFNRRRFGRELERELSASARYGSGGAMLVLDLDDFKVVNDSFGHAAGDDLLVEVATALRERVRDSDIIARLGGDEFGVILPHADEQRAVLVGESLREVVRELAIADGIRVTASVGVCGFGEREDVAAGERVVADADAAMYAAKESGRDRVGVLSEGDPRPGLRAA
jgi:diguanylate cyclase (GGDEF)-like protein/PAS domain S-box-containing protein